MSVKKMERRKILVLGIAIAVIVCALTFPVHAAEPTTSVHIIKYASDGTVLGETAVTYEWMKTNLLVCGDGATHYYHQGPVFDSPPGPWNPDETTNFKDKGAVKGTNVKDLCDLVGGMSPGDEIKVSATDGFSKWFNYTNVYEPQPRQGPIVLCWYKDGNYVPDYEGGMQIVFFADNSTNPEHKHVFGNWDMHECLSEKYWHNFSAVYPSTNGLSVKYIDEIAIYSNETTWNLTLTGNETKVYTLDEIKAMPSYTASGGFKKRSGAIVGPYTYRGVNITYLAGLVGGLTPSSSVTVTASDGYAMTYTYDQIMGEITTYNATTGEPEPDGPVNMILAYEEGGKPIPDEQGGPLRVAFVGPDSPITDGHFWIKWVNKIEILGGVEEWNLTLRGAAITEVMDRSTFESGVGCHGVSWTDDKNRTWEGIPLWKLVGWVDDSNKHDFNDTLADLGYNVTVIASDGYSKTFNSSFVARNDNIIVANELNGTALPEKYWPLRLVGPDLKKSEMVRNVVEIRITELMLHAFDTGEPDITFDESFTLKAGETYYYTIRTGSYPQIIHAREFNATGGTITCTEFLDTNEKIHDNWIPAIRLERFFSLT